MEDQIMQVITNEQLRQLIEEAKAAGKDVAEMERTLEDATARVAEIIPPVGERQEKTNERGKVVIESTGPAREDDFE